MTTAATNEFLEALGIEDVNLGGFGGDDVPADAGLTPRGAMWVY